MNKTSNYHSDIKSTGISPETIKLNLPKWTLSLLSDYDYAKVFQRHLDAPDLGLIMSTNKRKSQGSTKAVN